jgi:predicted transcriptional regulator
MKKHNQTTPIKLAPGELEILELLWGAQQVSLSQARDWFHSRGRQLAMTTIHTRLNRLVDKGVVRRVAENPAVYEAAIDRSEVSGRYFELFEELCGQNIVPLMAHLAKKRDFSPEELAFLENLVKQKLET